MLLLLLQALCTPVLFGQLLNGSFEDGGAPSFEHWTDQCSQAQLVEEAPPGGGAWSLSLPAGNVKSCFPGYVYQVLDAIEPGQSYLLTGWVKNETPITAGIYLGKIDELGQISTLQGDTTTADEWTFLSVQGDFPLGANEMAAIVLSGGLTGGPSQPSPYPLFDLIELSAANSAGERLSEKAIHAYPVPATDELTVEWPAEWSVRQVRLLGADGRCLLDKAADPNFPRMEFVLSGMPGGLYLLQLQLPGRVLHKRIVATGK